MTTTKAKVSSEELQRQLAEQLPSAMEAAELATGKTRDEILKMMKDGKLMSKDFMLPFARALRTLARRNGALTAAQDKLASQQNRLYNSFKIMVDEIFQNGGAKSIGNLFNKLSVVIEKMTPVIREAASAMFEYFTWITDGVGAVVELAHAFSVLIGVGELLALTWEVVGRVFDGISTAVYSVIGAIQWVSSLLRGGGAFDQVKDLLDFSNYMPSTTGTLATNANVTAAATSSSNSTTISADTINVQADNPQDFMTQVTEQFAY